MTDRVKKRQDAWRKTNELKRKITTIWRRKFFVRQLARQVKEGVCIKHMTD